ncbi:SDR family NAD(P)-dependent oxidoreductase [Burkholderia plantarii]|uniref:SDR family NAD(P)-dependent oxidoreductase n=1 Tax=Burkholderia plantarii TaxID=41899 RepID=UPI0006D8901F|nr:SDR family NAD(P)-dependent oxidoreductase [Burkholderia plantarii]ALK32452.1 short-chain dehydrogenase/reductase SDR [Burkholderia plantarii]GLZ19000.1 short-chain dehydrogenase/reductase [Burkholderia plantarii]
MATWLITGANRGLGLEIARAALDAGDRVLATARDPAPIAAALDGFGERLATTRLDVTDAASIAAAVDLARQRFGGIDVLVNNAGYGQLGPFELISPAAIERQFDTNVFGAFEVTRAVLPVMRAQRSGHVVTLSSIAGLIGIEGASIYCASKFALEGWSESLGQEVARFGIRTMLIEPGRFRTDFLDASSVSHGDLAIDDYATLAADSRAELDAGNHQQAGDPVKLGRAVVTLVHAPEPPVRYGAGSEAYGVMVARAERLRAEAEAWRELSLSNDLDA